MICRSKNIKDFYKKNADQNKCTAYQIMCGHHSVFMQLKTPHQCLHSLFCNIISAIFRTAITCCAPPKPITILICNECAYTYNFYTQQITHFYKLQFESSGSDLLVSFTYIATHNYADSFFGAQCKNTNPQNVQLFTSSLLANNITHLNCIYIGMLQVAQSVCTTSPTGPRPYPFC